MIDELKPLLGKLSLFAKDRLKFSHPPKLFLKNDIENSNMALGKTAHYNPEEESVTLYVTKRHPKDILRSFAHELVHHTQNLRGDLAPEKMGHMDKSYAQDNEHMRNMEKEAYLQGNMCFRDWEDGLDKKELYIIKIAESKFLKESKKVNKETLEDLIRKVLKEAPDDLTGAARNRVKDPKDRARAFLKMTRTQPDLKKKPAYAQALNTLGLGKPFKMPKKTKTVDTSKMSKDELNLLNAKTTMQSFEIDRANSKDKGASLDAFIAKKYNKTPDTIQVYNDAKDTISKSKSSNVNVDTAIASSTPSAGLSGQSPVASYPSDEPEVNFSDTPDLSTRLGLDPTGRGKEDPELDAMISEPEPAKAAAAKAKAANKAVRKRRSAPVASSAPVTGDKIKMIRGKAYPSPFTRLSSRVRRRKAFAQNRLVGPGEDAGADSIGGLQRLLIAAGYLPTGEDDGNYGSKTYSAIRNLQKDLIRAGDLPRLNSKGRSNADGIYGKDTNKALKTGKSGILQGAIEYKNAKRKFEDDIGTGSMTMRDGSVVDNSQAAKFDRFRRGIKSKSLFDRLRQNKKNQTSTTRENKENTMKKINEIAMGHGMMEFEAEERARDAQSEQGADALSILQGLIDGGKITADELEQAAAMLRKGEEEAERKMPGNQGFSKKEQDAMSDEEYDAYFRMNEEDTSGKFPKGAKVRRGKSDVGKVEVPNAGGNLVGVIFNKEVEMVPADKLTVVSEKEPEKEKSDAAKNESKVQTPEQENTLYESRFNNRNNQLFDKLINKWTK